MWDDKIASLRGKRREKRGRRCQECKCSVQVPSPSSHLEVIAECGELLHGDGLAAGNEGGEHVRDAVFQEGAEVAASQRLATSGFRDKTTE